MAEIANLLSVQKGTVHKWRHRGILPEPDYQLSIGPLWDEDTIAEWAEKTGRR
jgi:hypothetical protein